MLLMGKPVYFDGLSPVEIIYSSGRSTTGSSPQSDM